MEFTVNESAIKTGNEEFKLGDLVHVTTDYVCFTGYLSYIDVPYKGIIIANKDNPKSTHYMDLVFVKEISHLES